MERFSVRANRRCQRGLAFVYELTEAPDLERLEADLCHAFGDRLVRSEESWGARSVRRLVLQFRFEVRLGESDRAISFLYRSTANEEARAADRTRFEAVLAGQA